MDQQVGSQMISFKVFFAPHAHMFINLAKQATKQSPNPRCFAIYVPAVSLLCTADTGVRVAGSHTDQLNNQPH